MKKNEIQPVVEQPVWGNMKPVTNFWKWVALVFALLAVGAVLVALRCSQPLACKEGTVTFHKGDIVKCEVERN